MAQSLASRSRDSRRNTSDSDDIFMARALQFSAWAKNNARLVVAIVVAAAVLIGGFLWYRADRANRLEQAATEFLQLQRVVGSGNTELAVRDLERFAQRFEGTSYAEEAQVLLGRLHLQLGEPREAIEALDGVAGRIGDSPLGVPAAMLLGNAQAQAGNREEAIATFLNVADGADAEYQHQEALASAALLRAQADDFAGAAELYRQLVETADEGSAQYSVYRMRLAEAEASAGTP